MTDQPMKPCREFEADKAKYHAEWSDDDCPITAQEDDAYKAGWYDGWQTAKADLAERAEAYAVLKCNQGFNAGLATGIKTEAQERPDPVTNFFRVLTEIPGVIEWAFTEILEQHCVRIYVKGGDDKAIAQAIYQHIWLKKIPSFGMLGEVCIPVAGDFGETTMIRFSRLG